MKKTVLFVLMTLGTCGVAFAQNEYSEQKRFAVEVQFNPLSTVEKKEMFSLGSHEEKNYGDEDSKYPVFNEKYMLRAKYFISDQNALRMGVGLGMTNILSNSKYTKDSNTKGIFSLSLGDEYHFFSHGRLDMYAGGDLGLFYAFHAQKIVTNKGEDTEVSTKYHNRDQGGNVSQLGIRLGAFTGLNFFVYKQLYVGTELGLRYSMAKMCYSSDKTQTTDGGNNNSYKTDGQPKESNLKFYVEPSIRLGWMF